MGYIFKYRINKCIVMNQGDTIIIKGLDVKIYIQENIEVKAVHCLLATLHLNFLYEILHDFSIQRVFQH